MPLIDYKITPAERTAAYVQSQPDTVIGTPALGKQIYDEYPDLIRDNHDGLCDYIATMPIAYLSSAAAATAAKGSITGFVPLGGIIELSMTNGNTAVSPTVSIDGVTHTISGMPTTAQVQANSVQTYRLVKTGATVLTFTKNPDYICEYGTGADGVKYFRGAKDTSITRYEPTDYISITPSFVGTQGISVTSGYIRYYPATRMVVVSIIIACNALTTGASYTIATFPIAYSPSTSIPLAVINGSPNVFSTAYIATGTNAIIASRVANGTNNDFIMNGSYFI